MTFVLIALASYRLTRLVNLDVITTRPRKWAQRQASGKLEYFVTCPWCVSIYVAGAVVLVTDLVTSVPVPALQWLAASTVCGFLGGFDGE